MNVRELIMALSKLDPEMPVVMERTPEYLGDSEVAGVTVEQYARERDTFPRSHPEPTEWCMPEYARDCDPPQSVAFLSYEPPVRDTIDAEIERPAIESVRGFNR
ncbi:hypothetical protein PROPHIGD39-2_26 [Mycobacterium phage prophiGD39-2]|uniref:hypothetical protein n=1 Tax=Mycobacteroides abscessus TaxID=36809 RepID=UPI000683426C|nr:hypothetical protein [Mycobacteroides abscessus]QPO17299.1 hypothetical protein PHIGD57-1_60 [Mycobacterium phage phiGD57-1]QST88881.1 hypothetical protein PROPHIGD57-1_26 [Mycobacterium phage prophiGD25-1]QST89143.1 hypothetical protein PROPHIGD39-2_26 [Mycobacterium phage prophiGD39-2]QST89687.1 hypothetical protein PROPHIGD57-1_26 [Mycobacterium phage prophi57-1]KNB64088.1 hypothetical protein MAUC95_22025 [Mycobacteroides abscessus]